MYGGGTILKIIANVIFVKIGDMPRPLPTPGGSHGDPRLCQHLLRVALRLATKPKTLCSKTSIGGSKSLCQEDYHTF